TTNSSIVFNVSLTGTSVLPKPTGDQFRTAYSTSSRPSHWRINSLVASISAAALAAVGGCRGRLRPANSPRSSSLKCAWKYFLLRWRASSISNGMLFFDPREAGIALDCALGVWFFGVADHDGGADIIAEGLDEFQRGGEHHVEAEAVENV